MIANTTCSRKGNTVTFTVEILRWRGGIPFILGTSVVPLQMDTCSLFLWWCPEVCAAWVASPEKYHIACRSSAVQPAFCRKERTSSRPLSTPQNLSSFSSFCAWMASVFKTEESSTTGFQERSMNFHSRNHHLPLQHPRRIMKINILVSSLLSFHLNAGWTHELMVCVDIMRPS